jgi:hypothetical protein
MWGTKAAHCTDINLSILYAIIGVTGLAMGCSNVTNRFKNAKLFRDKTLYVLSVNDVSEDRRASIFIVKSSKERRR